jgi:hypothetical protein
MAGRKSQVADAGGCGSGERGCAMLQVADRVWLDLVRWAASIAVVVWTMQNIQCMIRRAIVEARQT